MKGYENDTRVMKQLRDEQDITYQQGGAIVGSACTCLARRLGWRRVIVLFDNAGGSDTIYVKIYLK